MLLGMREAIVELYSQSQGGPPETVTRIAADGSQRTYYRLERAGATPIVGGWGPEAEENRAFLAFSRALHGAGLPVPCIYAADEALGIWLEEDFGDTTLFSALSAARAASAAARSRAPPGPARRCRGRAPAATGSRPPRRSRAAGRRSSRRARRLRRMGALRVRYVAGRPAVGGRGPVSVPRLRPALAAIISRRGRPGPGALG